MVNPFTGAIAFAAMFLMFLIGIIGVATWILRMMTRAIDGATSRPVTLKFVRESVEPRGQ